MAAEESVDREDERPERFELPTFWFVAAKVTT
jgi:hypothetical protein